MAVVYKILIFQTNINHNGVDISGSLNCGLRNITENIASQKGKSVNNYFNKYIMSVVALTERLSE